MGEERQRFASEERMSRSDLVAFIRQLADKIEAGEVILRQGEEEITLQIPARVILEVEVEDEDKGAKGVEHSFELEVTWFDDESGGPLEIS